MMAIYRPRGYTLVELMVALAAGSFLLAGVSLSYSAIKGTISVSKELENAQEVIRYTSKVFTRSIKQTPSAPLVAADGSAITVTQPAGVITCNGSVSTADINEVYSLVGNNLMCTLGAAPAERLLTGVARLSFAIDNNIVTIYVGPENLPAQFEDTIAIDIAVSNVILNNAFGGV
ncbi:prepilin-type N-terminal cleavage/methylation domain-containing protein [Pseudoalteromonas sp. SR44-5]|uniref:PilW family protein n=1 Tax=unclassified Pseudoalteromonas TaxID=194690 RepID=UPI00160424DF|nr:MULTISPECIES: prepilin-type N-terminal cleavage/methylation domain-containing protein [unclassified Pseudoalteromonas]MBB1333324.1 prepilin-type N-terminal cleavage/methylation domain-containing protein [Pseudoalteromonas sp. SR41-6]MBB1341310.1 prepilin-type N-terminal cleavage/methylation domain-containing protein [Pseudoalteromonas sp. SR45-6]MBB1366513.1 prepilin-type N-terminal cleavage/methylation domain-containing protein [Pseudoalteromonas sp. SR44-5]MBB1422479.1 prepilin-type N-term